MTDLITARHVRDSRSTAWPVRDCASGSRLPPRCWFSWIAPAVTMARVILINYFDHKWADDIKLNNHFLHHYNLLRERYHAWSRKIWLQIKESRFEEKQLVLKSEDRQRCKVQQCRKQTQWSSTQIIKLSPPRGNYRSMQFVYASSRRRGARTVYASSKRRGATRISYNS
jgi:hypothetical protein